MGLLRQPVPGAGKTQLILMGAEFDEFWDVKETSPEGFPSILEFRSIMSVFDLASRGTSV